MAKAANGIGLADVTCTCGVGAARGGDADDPVDAAVAVAKLPDPQRVRPAVPVEVADLSLGHAGRGRGPARRAARRGERPRRRHVEPRRRHHQQRNQQQRAAFPATTPGRNGRPAQRPASASNSSGRPSLISPDRFMKPTPVGTSVGKARSIGRASSGDSSTIRTRSGWRPRLQRDFACGPDVSHPVRAGEAGDDVPLAVHGHRGHRRRPGSAGLAAGHGQHHRAFAAEAHTRAATSG